MFRKWYKRKVVDAVTLFNGHFIEVKAFYALQFNAVPCVTFISELDMTKAYAFINEELKENIVAVYQHSYFDHQEQDVFFNNTIMVLSGNRMVELGANYCQVLHTTAQYAWAKQFVSALAAFRLVNKEPAIGFAVQTAMN